MIASFHESEAILGRGDVPFRRSCCEDRQSWTRSTATTRDVDLQALDFTRSKATGVDNTRDYSQLARHISVARRDAIDVGFEDYHGE
jgi:hypothetical protein